MNQGSLQRLALIAGHNTVLRHGMSLIKNATPVNEIHYVIQ
jgi:hypothetical protein